MPLDDEFQQDEAQAGARGEGGVEEPETGAPFLEGAYDPAGDAVASEKGRRAIGVTCDDCSVTGATASHVFDA